MTVTIPAWWFLVFPIFLALTIAQTYFAHKQLVALRELFALYLRERHGGDFE